MPLRYGEDRPGANSYVKLRNEDKSITLGTHEGSMSEAFRQFRFAEVSEGQWLAEESIFHEQGKISYTMRAKTKLTVLEIASLDLKQVLIQDFKEFLLSQALNKHVLLLNRMQQIIKTSQTLHRTQEMSGFYDLTLRTLVNLHPTANKKLLRNIAGKFHHEGKVII